MSLDYNSMKMTDGTDYRVLVDFPELVQILDTALKEGGLITLPMGMHRPGTPKVINPQHVVSLTDYSDA
jgi:hypothetical protein